LIETQVLGISNSEDLVKLRAMAKLCSQEYFNDPSLLIVAWRRIMEVLETKKGVGENDEKGKVDLYELEILDACAALASACNRVRDFEDARLYFKRAKDGYEEQLGRDSKKALDMTYWLIGSYGESLDVKIEKYSELLKKIERALGDENVVNLETHALGGSLDDNGQYEKAKEVWERYLAGRMKVVEEDNKDTLMTLNNLGATYHKLENYKKALEYYERALKAKERMLGMTHPSTLRSNSDVARVTE